jgi:hypothetical protein
MEHFNAVLPTSAARCPFNMKAVHKSVSGPMSGADTQTQTRQTKRHSLQHVYTVASDMEQANSSWDSIFLCYLSGPLREQINRPNKSDMWRSIQ